jgi:glycoside/pentoside/hexuronide:cation symporter, GPH family
MEEVKLESGWGKSRHPAPKVPMKKKLAYSFNQMGINILWQAFNTVAVYFYVTELKVPGVQISIIMIVYGIVNAFLNLLAGHLSDRTHTRFGRRIPYIALASLPFAAAFYFLFSPPALGHTGLLIYFVILTFLFDLFFTFTALNAGALFPEMYPEERDRVFVSALQQVFSIIGMIAGVALAKSLGTALSWHIMALIFAGIGVITMYVSLYGSFENPKYSEAPFKLKEAIQATFQNRRFLIYVAASFLIQFTTTLFMGVSSFYTKYVVPLDALQSSLFLGGIFVVAMPFSFIWARLAVRFTTAKMVLFAVVFYMVVCAAFLLDQTPTHLLIHGLVMGIPLSGFMVLLTVLLADVIDYDAILTGKRREGMYLGMNGFIVRLGMSLQYAVMAIFFQVSGYNASAPTQSSGTILGFRLLLGAVPLIFLILAFLLLFKYKKEAQQGR